VEDEDVDPNCFEKIMSCPSNFNPESPKRKKSNSPETENALTPKRKKSDLIVKSGTGLSDGQKKLRKRHEKTVVILILIVLVFLICHSFRLGVQTFQVKT
jgi:hypothetical protein